MSDTNTRREKRTPVILKIKFKSATIDQFIERYSVDVSHGGIFIRTKEPLAVGTQLRFEFQLQDASPLIGGDGTVVWTREHDPARVGVAPGMGVRFDKLNDTSKVVLDRILAQKAGRDAALDAKFEEAAGGASAAKPAPAAAAAAPAATEAKPDAAASAISTVNAWKPPAFDGRLEDDFDDQVFHQPTRVSVIPKELIASGKKEDEEDPVIPPPAATPEATPAPTPAAAAPTPAPAPTPSSPPVLHLVESPRVQTTPGVTASPQAPAPIPVEKGFPAAESPMQEAKTVNGAVKAEATPAPVVADSPRQKVIVDAELSVPAVASSGQPVPVPAPAGKKRSSATLVLVGSVFVVAAVGIVVVAGSGGKPPAPPAGGAAASTPAPATTPAPAVTPPAPASSGVAVSIVSNPPGARIEVDGVPLPAPTPTTMSGLDPARTYAVVAKKECFQQEKAQLKPVAGKPLSIDLTPLARVIRVTSEPPGARVTIDGKPAGPAPRDIRLSGSLDPKQPHTIAVTLAGYDTAEETVPPDATCRTEAGVGLVERRITLTKAAPPPAAPPPAAPPPAAPAVSAPVPKPRPATPPKPPAPKTEPKEEEDDHTPDWMKE